MRPKSEHDLGDDKAEVESDAYRERAIVARRPVMMPMPMLMSMRMVVRMIMCMIVRMVVRMRM